MEFTFSIEHLKDALLGAAPEFNARHYVNKVTGGSMSKDQELQCCFIKFVEESDLPNYVKEALVADAKKPCHDQMTKARKRFQMQEANKIHIPHNEVSHRRGRRVLTPTELAARAAEKEAKEKRAALREAKRRDKEEAKAKREADEAKRNEVLKRALEEFFTSGVPSIKKFLDNADDEIRRWIPYPTFYMKVKALTNDDIEHIIAEKQAREKKAADEEAAKKAEEEARLLAEQQKQFDEAKKAEEERLAALHEEKAIEADENAKAMRTALRNIGILDIIEKEIPRATAYSVECRDKIGNDVQPAIRNLELQVQIIQSMMTAVMNKLGIPLSEVKMGKPGFKLVSTNKQTSDEELPSFWQLHPDQKKKKWESD
jgi:hypothetical protein